MKLRVIETIQIGILILLCIATIIFFCFKMNFSILCIIIAIGALAYAALIVIEEGIDQRDFRQICYLDPREKDDNLLNDIQEKLNELYKSNKIVDSVKIIEAAGYEDNRKEVYIIYH